MSLQIKLLYKKVLFKDKNENKKKYTFRIYNMNSTTQLGFLLKTIVCRSALLWPLFATLFGS